MMRLVLSAELRFICLTLSGIIAGRFKPNPEAGIFQIEALSLDFDSVKVTRATRVRQILETGVGAHMCFPFPLEASRRPRLRLETKNKVHLKDRWHNIRSHLRSALQ
eukprot:TRINITY_DN97043_c0_g1_i1.p1 TRINITY_DN97043_c0_g1~~TRINITY_DN97043_c0_g1_i1.p1  ORF type:complete len:107 (+),score=8.06 TRINITY_DN97043_c0_g1_i1:1-321(+)